MITALGHLIQVVHILVAWAVFGYSGYQNIYVAPIFIVLIVVGWWMFGDCFVNIWANRTFQLAGHDEQYQGLWRWFGDLTGRYYNTRTGLALLFFPPFIVGLIARYLRV